MRSPKTSPLHRPSRRKEAIRELSDRLASERDAWIERNSFFYEQDVAYLRQIIEPGQRVLELGCGTGWLLDALKPSRGVGIDFSAAMIDEARRRNPGLEFMVGDIEDPATLEQIEGSFDVVVSADTVGSLDDCQAAFAHVHRICRSDTRFVVAYFSQIWGPVLRMARLVGQHMPQTEQNWLSARDLGDILELAGFDVVRFDQRQVVPKRLGGLGRFANRFIGTLPGAQALCLRTYVVARPESSRADGQPSATIVIPCRNEAGNVTAAVDRMPRFCDDLEIIFVEGHSNDDTVSEIKRVISEHPELDIKVVQQDGVGKGDAVRKGFAMARGDVLMILDADLTVPPEDLPKFYNAIVSGKAEFAMGTRLVYPMEDEAMRSLNIVGNKVFSLLFTWLLNQRITDTLCGTKALSRANYEKIIEGRRHLGDFDPFGDFDLIFGAARLNLKILEVPVRYRARAYGTTQISRFQHGWLLLKMVFVAWRKLKAI